jgi:AraC-like DNA-binding protein
VPRTTPRSGLTVSALQAAAVLIGLQAAGADAEAVLARVGLSPDDLTDPERRLPREIILALWEGALEVTGDEAFGLHVAEQIRPGTLDVLEYLVRSSATLGDAIGRAARYVRLIDDVAEMAAESEGDRVTYLPRLAHDLTIPKGVMECVLAATVRVSREVTGTDLVPYAVELKHAPPRDLREYVRIFGPGLRFGAARNAITFTAAQLALPLVTADRALSAILDRHADELLRKLPPATRFSHRVRALLAAELRGGDPALDTIAAELHMSPRTLRRRLEEEDTSLQILLDELRRELAVRYLDEQKLTLDEVAFELGFADGRAFRRAFKRWTGRTPRGKRAAQRRE